MTTNDPISQAIHNAAETARSRIWLPKQNDQVPETFIAKDIDPSTGGLMDRPLQSKIIVSTLPFVQEYSPSNIRMMHPHDPLDEDPMRGLIKWRYRALTRLIIPAAPLGGHGIDGWSALQVFSYYQLVEDPSKMAFIDEAKGQLPTWEARWTPPQVLTSALLQGSKAWGWFPGGGYNSYVGVGMAVVDRVSDITSSFIRDLQKRRDATLQDVIRHGDTLNANPVSRMEISEAHRAAARILGLQRAWVDEMVANKSCIACDRPIRPNALVCSECGTELPKFAFDQIREGFLKLEELQHSDPFVAGRVAAKLANGDQAAEDSGPSTRVGRPRKQVPVAPVAEPASTPGEDNLDKI